MGSKIIGARIQADKAIIIEMYANDISISNIAVDYDVKVDTICRRLRKWGVKIKSNDWHKKEKSKRIEQKFSPELLAKMKENSRINNDKKKGIQYVKFGKATRRDQYLIHNIINRPVIG